eukprot:TRINITY_DN2849_c0_g2_i1.p1 TRINITY_DN2849_c0_g2~~TRINITY_DN2849_c0_g2_i1.p1  ORF type:complete len:1161 (+),score=314.56 TRINITY_DN2849_c0_g2_i1:1982-5464(+)
MWRFSESESEASEPDIPAPLPLIEREIPKEVPKASTGLGHEREDVEMIEGEKTESCELFNPIRSRSLANFYSRMEKHSCSSEIVTVPVFPIEPSSATTQSESPTKSDFSDDTLQFSADFESGNLAKADRVFGRSCAHRHARTDKIANRESMGSPINQEYDLLIRCDYHTHGHVQWFYFATQNMQKGTRVKFNLLNHSKPDSLFNYGMQPCIYSQRAATIHNRGWHRDGLDICYFRNQHTRRSLQGLSRKTRGAGLDSPLYTASFVYEFQYDSDIVYFAYCFPYSFSKLLKYLTKLELNPRLKNIVRRREICRSLAGNRVDLLTITSPSTNPGEVGKKKGLVLSARVHPGESVASHMMHGVMEFLVADTPEARVLRENLVIKLVPMLNPDGVVNGNYRCSLAGCDLNRRWHNPSWKLHPVISSVKHMIKRFSQSTEMLLFCDFHGHSRKKNIFMYGCSSNKEGAMSELMPRVFPRILWKLSPAPGSTGKFSFVDSHFRVQKSKMSTGRVVVHKECNLWNSYTMEASFCGSGDNKKDDLLKQQVRRAMLNDRKKKKKTTKDNKKDMKRKDKEKKDKKDGNDPIIKESDLGSGWQFGIHDFNEMGRTFCRSLILYCGLESKLDPESRLKFAQETNTMDSLSSKSGKNKNNNNNNSKGNTNNNGKESDYSTFDDDSMDSFEDSMELDDVTTETNPVSMLSETAHELERLIAAKVIDDDDSVDDDSGSDSCPSEDNLEENELQQSQLFKTLIERNKKRKKKGNKKKKKKKKKQSISSTKSAPPTTANAEPSDDNTNGNNNININNNNNNDNNNNNKKNKKKKGSSNKDKEPNSGKSVPRRHRSRRHQRLSLRSDSEAEDSTNSSSSNNNRNHQRKKPALPPRAQSFRQMVDPGAHISSHSILPSSSSSPNQQPMRSPLRRSLHGQRRSEDIRCPRLHIGGQAVVDGYQRSSKALSGGAVPSHTGGGFTYNQRHPSLSYNSQNDDIVYELIPGGPPPDPRLVNSAIIERKTSASPYHMHQAPIRSSIEALIDKELLGSERLPRASRLSSSSSNSGRSGRHSSNGSTSHSGNSNSNIYASQYQQQQQHQQSQINRERDEMLASPFSPEFSLSRHMESSHSDLHRPPSRCLTPSPRFSIRKNIQQPPRTSEGSQHSTSGRPPRPFQPH